MSNLFYKFVVVTLNPKPPSKSIKWVAANGWVAGHGFGFATPWSIREQITFTRHVAAAATSPPGTKCQVHSFPWSTAGFVTSLSFPKYEDMKP